MTDETDSSKKPAPRRRGVGPVADEAFANRQLGLFQGFLASTDDQREALSNAVDLWDSIPRYAVSRARMGAMRTPEGFLPVMELPFNYRGRSLSATIYPAQVTASGSASTRAPGKPVLAGADVLDGAGFELGAHAFPVQQRVQ